jgi:4-hydroxythreonine-4-phosphate dehydrogenase
VLSLGILLGDVTGIGPEVAFKALACALPEDDTVYVVIGDAGVARYYCGLLGYEGDIPQWSDRSSVPSRLYVQQPDPEPLPDELAQGGAEAARAAMSCLREGARLCLAGELDGIVTAPVSKETIIQGGFPWFVGQTEFLSELAHAKRTAMMLLGSDDRGHWLRVALATNHVPLQKVSSTLSAEGITKAIELAVEACDLLGLPQRRIAVCGLNPHAGEGGAMGMEEVDLIEPTVQAARERGLPVEGPFPADTLFHRAYRGDFEAVVAMYHDQGLVPLKMIAFENGVNWTLGLPFVRTSPDHGTAYDIAGQGIAESGSMLAAIRLARRIASVRSGKTVTPSALPSDEGEVLE